MAMPLPLNLPSYTITDLERFPDDGQRYELLEGFLLVTPAPGGPHQLIAARLMFLLQQLLGGRAYVTGPGVIERPPNTHLEPDVLVFPGPLRKDFEWSDLTAHWLAVEVLSRSSRRYDRDYKRDAYLALGVAEVWLVDRWDRAMIVCRPGEGERRVTGVHHWHPRDLPVALPVDIEPLFQDL
jgi:Uma2 family endonuclease